MYTFSNPNHSSHPSTPQPPKSTYSTPQSQYSLINTDNQFPQHTSTTTRAIVTRTSSFKDNRTQGVADNLISTHQSTCDPSDCGVNSGTNTLNNNEHTVSSVSLSSNPSHQTQNSPLARSKRCYSSDKLPVSVPAASGSTSSSSIKPDASNTNPHQRGSSVRLSGKTATLPAALTLHHDFRVIKTIDSSPRDSLDHVNNQNSMSISSNVPSASFANTFISSSSLTSSSSHTILSNSTINDSDNNTSASGSAKGLKLYSRHKAPISTPVLADYRLTPKQQNPCTKRNSYSDQEDPLTIPATSEAMISNGITKPPIPRSPTRPRVIKKPAKVKPNTTQATKLSTTGQGGLEIDSSPNDEGEEDGSDCETTAIHGIAGASPGTTTRSSLRKNSNNSPIQNVSDRNSPSPTKCVSWNLNPEMKNIPRSRSLSQKDRKNSSKNSGYLGSNSHNDKRNKIQTHHTDYMEKTKNNIQHQLKQLEHLKSNKISFQDYQKYLIKYLEEQKKLVNDFLPLLNEDNANYHS